MFLFCLKNAWKSDTINAEKDDLRKPKLQRVKKVIFHGEELNG